MARMNCNIWKSAMQTGGEKELPFQDVEYSINNRQARYT